ncbi:uncharacterized protein ACR2FA_008382 [Aphomia sociella]
MTTLWYPRSDRNWFRDMTLYCDQLTPTTQIGLEPAEKTTITISFVIFRPLKVLLLYLEYVEEGEVGTEVTFSKTELKYSENSSQTSEGLDEEIPSYSMVNGIEFTPFLLLTNLQNDFKSPLRETADYYIFTNDRFTCKTCDRAFASRPLVSQHYRFVHLKRRPKERKCPHCEERVPGYLRAYHLEEAHGVPAPACGVCGKKFRFPHNVLQHQKKVHMGEKTVVCKICDKGFFNNLSLRLHMTTHNDVRKFKCAVCGREFRWENNLKDHVKIHTGDKRYVCKVCGKAFVQKSTLKQHGFRNHPGVEVT